MRAARRTPAWYRDPDGRKRSAGSFSSRREALRAANREEQRVLAGSWHDATLGEVTFRAFVENEWLPSKHIEATTRAAYVSNLDKHFYPFFGARPMARISPSLVQDWVTKATADGLSPRSVSKYHTVLHSIFKRAVRDGLLVCNPCDGTELPKIIARKTRTLTAEEFERLIDAVPAQHRLMVATFIETGLRWGELIALRPRHIDFLRRIADRRGDDRRGLPEALPDRRAHGRQALPEGQRAPNHRRPPAVARRGRRAHRDHGIDHDDLLFPTKAGTPISRNTFRTRIWLPAVEASGIDFPVRIHDLRHAHASWLLAGGADLKSVMDRMGHAQIQTTQKYLHTLPDADQKNLDALEPDQTLRGASRTRLSLSASP